MPWLHIYKYIWKWNPGVPGLTTLVPGEAQILLETAPPGLWPRLPPRCTSPLTAARLGPRRPPCPDGQLTSARLPKQRLASLPSLLESLPAHVDLAFMFPERVEKNLPHPLQWARLSEEPASFRACDRKDDQWPRDTAATAGACVSWFQDPGTCRHHTVSLQEYLCSELVDRFLKLILMFLKVVTWQFASAEAATLILMY